MRTLACGSRTDALVMTPVGRLHKNVNRLTDEICGDVADPQVHELPVYTRRVKVRLRVTLVDDPDLIAEMSHGEIAVLRLVGSADSAATKPHGTLLDAIASCQALAVDHGTTTIQTSVPR